MLDGAALGTLMIGLESVRQEADRTEPSDPVAVRRSRLARSTLRVRLAAALRIAADRLDRGTSPALGSSSPVG